MKQFIAFLITMAIGNAFSVQAQDDPYLWLEEVDGVKALEYVEKLNKATVTSLTQQKLYNHFYENSLEILNDTNRIAYPMLYGDFIYNFWQDQNHVRGIWRRTKKQGYLNGNPDWEILIDLDAMVTKDSIKWVFNNATGLYPEYDLFLVELSKGGSDATVIREFDVSKKAFVDGGFYVPEAKNETEFIDRNTLIVSTDFGDGTMTSSGYPMQVRIWKRGTGLSESKLIHQGESTDVSVRGTVLRDGPVHYPLVVRSITFYTSHYFVVHNDELLKLDLPDDCEIGALLKDLLAVNLKSDWEVNNQLYTKGSLVTLNFTALLSGEKQIHLVFEPDKQSSITQVGSTKNKLLVNVLTNVKNELYTYTFENNKWGKEKLHAPGIGSIEIVDADVFTDQFFFIYEDFLTPTTLYNADAGTNSLQKQKSLPSYFDASNYEVKQYKARSKDGTLIPYYVVASKEIKYNGKNPVALYAYGGFEIPMLPFYLKTWGKVWLENGGVYVLANIRGGGEFGPAWHQAGLKEKRQNVFDDFHAVADDLIDKNITSGEQLGILGGSNGGLLVGVAFTQRPDLYKAAVCWVPLLDMKRYNKLLAGASWMGEYGDPDKPEEWAYIKKYSPYHNLKKGVDYPEVFFVTSTRDDRVHPGHARKMAAKMTDMGYKIYYYENTEGGHAASSTNEQRARENALIYSYLFMKLMDAK